MPAEWEPQAAVWLQWPQGWEGRGVQDAFVDIVANLVDFEDVHLIVHDAALQSSAERSLGSVGLERVTFHVWPTDSSWLRDDGPRFVEVDGELVLQNWEFDGWGAADGSGGFGAVPYDLDNAIPDYIGAELALPIEHVSLIHERGDLEVNGQDTALVNWSVVSDRNPLGTSGDAAEEARAADAIGRYFPGRVVRFADVDALWRNGGGIHCVTNDQPEAG